MSYTPRVIVELTAAAHAPSPTGALFHVSAARKRLTGVPGLRQERADLDDAQDALRLLMGTPGPTDDRSFKNVLAGVSRVRQSLTSKAQDGGSDVWAWAVEQEITPAQNQKDGA